MATKRNRIDMCSPISEIPECRMRVISPFTAKKRKTRSDSVSSSSSGEDEPIPSLMPTCCLVPTFDVQSTARIKSLKPRGRKNAVDLLNVCSLPSNPAFVPDDETESGGDFPPGLFLD